MTGKLHKQHPDDQMHLLIDDVGCGPNGNISFSISLPEIITSNPAFVLGKRVALSFAEDLNTLYRASSVGPGKAFVEFPCPTIVLCRAFPGNETYWGQHWEKVKTEKSKQPYQFVWSDCIQPGHLFTNVDEAKNAVVKFNDDQENLRIEVKTYEHLTDDLDKQILEYVRVNRDDGEIELRLRFYVRLCIDLFHIACFLLISILINIFYALF